MRCPHAERCPGCALILLPYDEQLTHKREVVVRALGRYPSLAAAEVDSAVAAQPNEGYRVRAKLVAHASALGLYERGSHRVVDIPGCVIQRPRVLSAVDAVRALLPELGDISSLDVREVDDGVLVTAAVPPTTAEADRVRIAERIAEAAPSALTVATTTRAADAPQLLGGDLRVHRGPAAARHTLEAGKPWHYAAPGAFTQVHEGQTVRLHADIEARLRETGRLDRLRVLELYAGSGALALRLAASGAQVSAVESFAPALELLARAAREQRLSLHAVRADAGAALAELVAARRRFDVAIVDPPRRGLAPDVRRLVARATERLLVYVSCEPATLARDASHLALLGWRLVRATPYDMIPQSDAVETLAHFQPGTAPPPRVLFETASYLAVEKAPHEPMTPAAEHTSSLLQRVRALPGAEHAVAVGGLEAFVSGVAIFARSAALHDTVRDLVGGASFEFTALVRGPLRARGSVSRPLRDARGTRPTRTRYERRELLSGHALLTVSLDSPRSDVVRRHLAGIGHPVLGDHRDGDRRSNLHFEHRHTLDRPFLHCASVTLSGQGEPRTFTCPLSPDLEAVLASLRSV